MNFTPGQQLANVLLANGFKETTRTKYPEMYKEDGIYSENANLIKRSFHHGTKYYLNFDRATIRFFFGTHRESKLVINIIELISFIASCKLSSGQKYILEKHPKAILDLNAVLMEGTPFSTSFRENYIVKCKHIKELGLDKILYFIKIGKKLHIDNLYNRGEVFCQTVEYFIKLENDKEKGDKNEGVNVHIIPSWVQIQIDNKKYTLVGEGSDIKISNPHIYGRSEEPCGNIFCVTYVSALDIIIGNIPSERLSGFGDTMLIIKNPSGFIDRVLLTADTLGATIKHRDVYYYDLHKEHHDLNIFCKSDEYHHQQEYRLHIRHKTEGEPIKLVLGSLKDIAVIMPVNGMNKIGF